MADLDAIHASNRFSSRNLPSEGTVGDATNNRTRTNMSKSQTKLFLLQLYE